MVDYAKLADDARLIQHASRSAYEMRRELRAYWRSSLSE